MRQLSQELRKQLYGQESDDPFLILLTLSHEAFDEDILLVNDFANIASRSKEYQAFPLKITMPNDDGESAKDIQLVLDNVSLELIEEIRTITSPIGVKIEMILASIPDVPQITIEDLKMRNATYNRQSISASLYLDDFLNTEMASEKYTPTAYAGLF